MGTQIVDTQGLRKVVFFLSTEEFGHVPEIAEPIVDRRSREHKKRLGADRTVQQVIKPVVTRPIVVVLVGSLPPGIAEVMCLVDYENVSKLCDTAEPLGEISLPV